MISLFLPSLGRLSSFGPPAEPTGFPPFLRATGGDLFTYVTKHNGLEQTETKYLLYQILKAVKVKHRSEYRSEACQRADLASSASASICTSEVPLIEVSVHLDPSLYIV